VSPADSSVADNTKETAGIWNLSARVSYCESGECVFDFFFDLFRKEKPLYRWRERPSLSAFLTQVRKAQKPADFWGWVLRLLGICLLGALAISVFAGLLGYATHGLNFMKTFQEAFLKYVFVIVFFTGGFTIFQSFQDRIIELYKDRLVVQEDDNAIPYSRLEYFRITQMRHASSDARFPCVALYTNLGESDQVDTFGLPNPKVAARVQEILSKFVPFRASEPSDDLEFNLS
jgi:hypothetical protein